MSRFAHLEFEDTPDPGIRPERVDELKDAGHFGTEARRAFREGEWEQALRYYAKVLEYDPGDHTAWLGQVRALLELEAFDEAREWAGRALEHFPEDPGLTAALAVVLARMGDLAAALPYSDSALHGGESNPVLWLARAEIMLARGEAAADYCFEKAVYLGRGDWEVPWEAARIRIYYGRYSAAIKALRLGLEWEDTQAVLWLQLGQCQSRLGLSGSARRSLHQALQLKPGWEQARNALAELERPGLLHRLSGLWVGLWKR